MRDKAARPVRDVPFLQALVGWGALVVVLVSALALGANRPVSWLVLSAAIFPLFVVQVVLDLIWGAPLTARRAWGPAILYLLALVWCVIQVQPDLPEALRHPIWRFGSDDAATISADPIAGLHHIMRLTCYGMVFWVLLRAAASPSRAIGFLSAIALFSSALAGFGIWTAWSGQNPILLEDASTVLTASFINRNSYATYAVFGAITNLSVYLYLSTGTNSDEKNRGRRLRNRLEKFFAGSWLFGLGFLLCASAVALTQSRAGSAAGVIALLTFVMVYRWRRKGQNIFLLLIVATVVAFVAGFLSNGLTERLLTTDSEDARFVIFPLVVDGILARPVLGHGLGAFQDAFREIVPVSLSNFDWDLAHNSYLENLFEMGIPAAALFYMALFWIAAIVFRGSIARRRSTTFARNAIACTAAAAFHSYFDFSLQMPATAALFAAILGIGWSQSFESPSP